MTTTFIILGITIVLFVWGRWPADLVAVLSLLALALSGVIGTSDALAGFGNPTVVMIAALFVVGDYSGRGQQSGPPRLNPVSVDNFDSVVNRLAPFLALEDGRLDFSEFDDFHPDHLVRSIADCSSMS